MIIEIQRCCKLKDILETYLLQILNAISKEWKTMERSLHVTQTRHLLHKID